MVIETLASVSWAVIPLRILHLAELAIVIVGADADPQQWKYPTSVGSLVIQKMSQEELFQQRAKRNRPAHLPASDADSSTSASTQRSAPPSLSSQLSPPDPWAAWRSRNGPAAVPAPSDALTKRADALEKHVKSMSVDVKTLQSDQQNTTATLQRMQAENQDGFKTLLKAIHELQSNSACSTPIASPLPKRVRGIVTLLCCLLWLLLVAGFLLFSLVAVACGCCSFFWWLSLYVVKFPRGLRKAHAKRTHKAFLLLFLLTHPAIHPVVLGSQSGPFPGCQNTHGKGRVLHASYHHQDGPNVDFSHYSPQQLKLRSLYLTSLRYRAGDPSSPPC